MPPSLVPIASSILLVVVLVVVVIVFDLCVPSVGFDLVVLDPRVSFGLAVSLGVKVRCLDSICGIQRRQGVDVVIITYKIRETSLCNLGSSLWMGEPSVDLSSEGVSSSCLKPACEHSCVFWEDEYVEAVISCTQDDLAVEEIGMALTEVMHVYNDEEGQGLDEDSDNNICDDPILSVESDSTDDLVDVDSVLPAFPSGDATESSVSNSVASSIDGTPRLVSAMKGTRAKKGIIEKLSVSWAPDVYDPPITSDSHTVRGHHRSSMKSNYKYKSKSSSRSTTGSKKDKKHSRHSSSSGGGSKRDRKHSSHSTSSASSSSRTVTSGSLYRNTYSGSGISSSKTVTCVPEFAKVSPLVVAANAASQETVPVLKTLEPIKCATSCGKEKPFALLSRQFSPARYKGMFSFWSQNQLAS